MLTTLTLTPEQQAASAPPAETVAQGAKALRTHGCLLLRDVFPPELIATLRDAVFARNEPLRRAQRPHETGKVGNRRFMGPIDLSGPFVSPAVMANPFVLPILRAVIGEELVLGACGTVTSLPGATAQHIHRDCPPLFNKVVNRMVPTHAVNFFVPLVEFNGSTGTTRLFPGTHIDTDVAPADAAFIDPVIPVGSCLLMDGRLYHQGLANLSDLVRPLLYFVFQQPWFKDYKNHPELPCLRISDAEYARLPAEHRRLLTWTEHYRSGLY